VRVAVHVCVKDTKERERGTRERERERERERGGGRDGSRFRLAREKIAIGDTISRRIAYVIEELRNR